MSAGLGLESESMQQQQQEAGERDPDAVSRLCLDCLRKSSVRGLPRILSSEGLHLRLLWSAAVAAFLAGLLYNLTALTIDFCRGDIIITERPQLPRPQFPSITVCDASPVSWVAAEQLSISPMEFRDRIRALRPAAEMSNLQGRLLERQLLNPLTYFDHLHRELENLTEHDSVVLRESCHVHSETATTNLIRQCNRVRRVNVPGFLSCSTIEPGQLGEKVVKVIFNVLLDTEKDPLVCRHCIPEHLETMRIGAVIFIHEKDAYPLLVDTGMYVTPGTQQFIVVKSKQTVLTGDCDESHPEKLDFAFHGQRLRSRYSDHLCQALARSEVIRQNCHCLAFANPQAVPDKDAYDDAEVTVPPSLPSCAETVLTDSPRSLDGVKCISKVDKQLKLGNIGAASNIRRCPKPCRYLEFTATRSASRGVTKNTALEIYKTLLANTTAGEKMRQHLQPYEDALRLKAQNRLTEARQIMEKADYLEQNFLTVSVWFPDKMSTMVLHQYIVSRASYFSQVGGLLSLFSGITVVCIAELMELLLNIGCRVRLLCRRRNKQGAARNSIA